MYPDWGVGFEDATMKGLLSAGYALISHPPSMAITPRSGKGVARPLPSTGVPLDNEW